MSLAVFPFPFPAFSSGRGYRDKGRDNVMKTICLGKMEEQAEISRRRTGERARVVSSLSQHEVDSVFPSNHSNAAEQSRPLSL